MKRKAFAAAGLLLLTGLLTACGTKEALSADFFAMDTFMTLTVYGGKQEALDEAETTIFNLENEISRTRENTDIYKLNAADGAVVSIDRTVYDMLSDALSWAEWTDGAFDPTVASLSDLWQIGTEDAHIPAEEELEQALQTVGYHNLVLTEDETGCYAQLLNGAKVDLGGIGKGEATDLCGALLGKATGALVQLGGNIGCYGKNPNREGGWSVGIADPDSVYPYLGTLTIEEGTTVTSGDYERYFEQDGVRYHHIFDPTTGYPAQSGLRAVTVVGAVGASGQSDALSTALFVMGLERGLEFCQAQGVDAVFITKDKQIVLTDGMQDCFQLAEGVEGYTVVLQ